VVAGGGDKVLVTKPKPGLQGRSLIAGAPTRPLLD